MTAITQFPQIRARARCWDYRACQPTRRRPCPNTARSCEPTRRHPCTNTARSWESSYVINCSVFKSHGFSVGGGICEKSWWCSAKCSQQKSVFNIAQESRNIFLKAYCSLELVQQPNNEQTFAPDQVFCICYCYICCKYVSEDNFVKLNSTELHP